jgi:hypothetical protein
MSRKRETAGFGTMAEAISESVPSANRSEYIAVRLD